MKKLLVLIATVFFTLNGMSQIFLDDKLEFRSPNRISILIPKEFCYDQIPHVQMYDDGSSSSSSNKRMLIYDENLKLKKEISLANRSFDYQLTYQDEEREVQSVTVDNEYEEDLRQSYSQFVEQNSMMDPSFSESKLTITKQENGDSLIIYDFTSYTSHYGGNLNDFYFAYSYFGAKYPRLYFKCKNGNMYRYRATYKVTYSDWVVTGTRTEDRSQNIRILSLCNLNLNIGDESNNYFVASQTLFNADEEFEYLSPKLSLTKGTESTSASPDSNDNITIKRSTLVTDNAQVSITGFQVVSSNGTVIKDLDFDNGFVISNSSQSYVHVVTIGSKVYLAFTGYVDNKKKTAFYQIEKGTNSIQQVKALDGGFTVSPTIADKGTPISINFGDGNNSGSDIIVYNANGNQIKQTKVTSGERSTQITLDNNSGVYLLTRKQPGKSSETRKIILR